MDIERNASQCYIALVSFNISTNVTIIVWEHKVKMLTKEVCAAVIVNTKSQNPLWSISITKDLTKGTESKLGWQNGWIAWDKILQV